MLLDGSSKACRLTVGLKMTESDWMACSDPGKMLEFLRGKVSDRKFRLFAVACCRLIWHLLPDIRCRQAVEISERFADGLISSKEDLDSGIILANKAARELTGRNWAASAVTALCGRRVVGAVWNTGLAMTTQAQADWLRVARHSLPEVAFKIARNDKCDLVRDIFRHPFRSIYLDPNFLTSSVKALASAIYDDRAFDRLPILADALTDAGCHEEEILNHCRGDGPHGRGCWVLDLLLGKQ